MKTRYALLLILSLVASASHAVPVTFSGTISRFNPGPFAGGETFTGSFTMDETVVPTGATKLFAGALDNFILTVGSYTFTGSNGNIRQFTGSGGATDFFSVSIGNGVGTLSGNVGSSILTGFSVDWRGADLFADPAVLANNLTRADFGFSRVSIAFDNSIRNTAINNASDIQFGPASSVPTPPTAWLVVAAALIGLLLGRRRPDATALGA